MAGIIWAKSRGRFGCFTPPSMECFGQPVNKDVDADAHTATPQALRQAALLARQAGQAGQTDALPVAR